VPVLVLQPVPPPLVRVAAERSLTLTLGDRAHVDAVVASHRAASGGGTSSVLLVQLEVETGLGRGGIDAADVPAAIDRLAATPGIELTGVWSHLQAPEDSARSTAQVARFERATADVGRRADRHLAASGGLVAGSAPAYEAVRPGLVLYGLVPDELRDRSASSADQTLSEALRPAMALRARPVRVADLPTGWGVSYGPTWTTTRPSRIATLPVGYGDGWPRSVSNRAEALVRGLRVPLVGNVAMDAVMADVTDVPGEPVTTDDVFTLIGRDGADEITAHDLALARTTNAWEVVTSMSARLARVYYLAAVPVGLRTLTSLALTGPRDTWPGSNSGTGTSATWRSTRS